MATFRFLTLTALCYTVAGTLPPATSHAIQPTSGLTEHQPKQAPLVAAESSVIISRRYAAERATLDNLAGRVAEAKHRLQLIAGDADRWLVREPGVLVPRVVPADSKAADSIVSEIKVLTATVEVPPWTTAEEMLQWSKDLWDPTPLRAQWLAIRKQDEEGLAASIELPPSLQKDYEEACAICRKLPEHPGTNLRDAADYQRYHELFLKLKRWSEPALAFAVAVSAFDQEFAVALMHRRRAVCMLGECSHALVANDPPGIFRGGAVRSDALSIVPGAGLGHDTAIAGRHRYAMSDRAYIADDRQSSETTWPICDQLCHAATNFDYWYRWATDERWYAGSDRKLGTLQWPPDAEKTRQLHAEFASVVLFKHCVFNEYPDYRGNMYKDRWSTGPYAPKSADELGPCVHNTQTHARPRILATYFRVLRTDQGHDDRTRIPPVIAPPPGRLVPPLEQK